MKGIFDADRPVQSESEDLTRTLLCTWNHILGAISCFTLLERFQVHGEHRTRHEASSARCLAKVVVHRHVSSILLSMVKLRTCEPGIART